MVLSFPFPRRAGFGIAGLEGAKNLAGKVLRLIQIRLVKGVFTQTVRISSSQASPNFHVGHYLRRVYGTIYLMQLDPAGIADSSSTTQSAFHPHRPFLRGPFMRSNSPRTHVSPFAVRR